MAWGNIACTAHERKTSIFSAHVKPSCPFFPSDFRYQQEKQDYEKRVQERIGSDRFASRHAQTVNWALKTKEVSSVRNDTRYGLLSDVHPPPPLLQTAPIISARRLLTSRCVRAFSRATHCALSSTNAAIPNRTRLRRRRRPPKTLLALPPPGRYSTSSPRGRIRAWRTTGCTEARGARLRSGARRQQCSARPESSRRSRLPGTRALGYHNNTRLYCRKHTCAKEQASLNPQQCSVP